MTRSGHEPVVIVPLAEYEAMKETEYLLRNPANATALRRSIAELEGDATDADRPGASCASGWTRGQLWPGLATGSPASLAHSSSRRS
ncbi:type II toxin-antitoxin system Phd/YefM family antitoxin [Micromonospora sp. C32]|uniref:type II toxin-antitoxin system Phd/YefM family antitoxin n=1 Tax=Micromonospora sp. C32 TaxID=2824877 RepID=UPI0027DE7DD8|nr:type II toxin-antitoxin system Phd/YefM family antitoxin [Micromonospora sp. C32]